MSRVSPLDLDNPLCLVALGAGFKLYGGMMITVKIKIETEKGGWEATIKGLTGSALFVKEDFIITLEEGKIIKQDYFGDPGIEIQCGGCGDTQ